MGKQGTKRIILKLIQFIILILVVSFVSFWLLDKSPIDPIVSYSRSRNIGLTDEQKEKLIQQWDLNVPLFQRYLLWIKNILSGNMGLSHIYNRPVLKIIQEGFFSSSLLLGMAWIFQGLFGFILGVLAGLHHRGKLDKVITRYAIVVSSTPTFWVAILMIMIFSLTLKWFPFGFGTPIGLEQSQVTMVERLYHAFLPSVTLAFIGTGNIVLHTRKKVIEVLDEDFVIYQKSRGLNKFEIIQKRAFRNILFPVITIQFSNFSELFSGAILAERAFNYQGLGNYSVEAGLRGDIPLLLGIVFFSAIFVFVGNQLADLMYLWIDYRINSEGGS